MLNVQLDAPIDLDAAPRERPLMSSPGPRRAAAPSGANVEGSVTPPSPFHHSPQMATNGAGMDMRFGYPPQMSLPQNVSGVGSPLPGMGGFPGMGAMMQQQTQRPQARPAAAFACS